MQSVGGDTVAQLVKNKVIISGNIIETYSYEKGYLKGYELSDVERAKKGRKKDSKSSEYVVNRGKVLQRARTRIRRLVNTNAGNYYDSRGNRIFAKFFTMTFGENIQDIKYANNEFKKFIKRLNYQVLGEKKSVLKYTAVIEFQERGAIHYHVIFYNMPFVRVNKLQEIWGNGFVKINAIDKVDNVGAYITKYMTKDNDDSRLQDEKCYFNSRDLKEPTIIDDTKEAEKVRTSLPLENLVYSCEFENEHTGLIKYHQFNSRWHNDASLKRFSLANVGEKTGEDSFEIINNRYCSCGAKAIRRHLKISDTYYFECLYCDAKSSILN